MSSFTHRFLRAYLVVALGGVGVCEGVSPEEVCGVGDGQAEHGVALAPEGCGPVPVRAGHCHLHRKTVGLRPACSALSAFSPPSHSGAWWPHGHAEHCGCSERLGYLF